jgi:hypothetical protein
MTTQETIAMLEEANSSIINELTELDATAVDKNTKKIAAEVAPYYANLKSNLNANRLRLQELYRSLGQ